MAKNIKKDRGLQLRMGVVMMLLAGLGITFASVIGYFLGNIIIAIVMVALIVVLQFAFGDKLALKSMGAKRVDNESYPELHSMVNSAAQQANVPMPDVAVAESGLQNAFAAGRSQDSSVVCVTTGLIKSLDEEELEAVIAHEVAHIKNRDVIVMTVAGVITMITGIIIRYSFFFSPGHGGGGGDERGAAAFAVIFVASILTYIVGYLLIRALSRYREHAADRGAAKITGNPTALAQALRKIDDSMEDTPKQDLREANGVSALMVSPVKSKISSLLSTHPGTEARIDRLNKMAKDMN